MDTNIMVANIAGVSALVGAFFPTLFSYLNTSKQHKLDHDGRAFLFLADDRSFGRLKTCLLDFRSGQISVQ